MTFVKIYELTIETVEPFTVNTEIEKPPLAEIENVRLLPDVTETEPEGEIDPPVPADAVTV